MKKKRHTPEQIVKKLRTASEELARGTSIEEVCRKLEVSVATYHRWNKQYGGAKMKRQNGVRTNLLTLAFLATKGSTPPTDPCGPRRSLEAAGPTANFIESTKLHYFELRGIAPSALQVD